jgi:hypothetical protein
LATMALWSRASHAISTPANPVTMPAPMQINPNALLRSWLPSAFTFAA